MPKTRQPIWSFPWFFTSSVENPAAVTDQQIMDALTDLNNAFAHTGPYAAGAPGVNTGIRFCLAKIDPDGGNTTALPEPNRFWVISTAIWKPTA